MSDNGASVELGPSGFADPAYYTGDLTALGRQTTLVSDGGDDGGAVVGIGIAISQLISGGSTIPLVMNVSPASSSTIQPTDALQFDVTDPTLRRAIVVVVYPSGDGELVHDGSAFFPPFVGSTRVAISNGFRFVVRRTGGWRAGVDLRVFAYNGQEA